jgi:asparagine synthase (glutamine-hydrolysing)
MFALALWDKERQSLLLARDRLGKKPLFFARLPDSGIAFASEPKALALHPDVSGEIDGKALAQYLRLNYVPCNRSLFAGVESLPPACYAEFDSRGRLRIARYWDLAAKFHEKRTFASEQQAAEELRDLIDHAVRARLVSDVPLGAFLSGGVDSSTILASMLTRRDPTSIYTFSSGFLEDSFDESRFAEQLARQFGAVHRTQTLDPRSLDLLPAVVATMQEPLADTSALPTFFLSHFTRQHVTVALSGDGGDECFAGYETYVADKLHRIASFLPRGLRAHAPGLLNQLLPVNHSKVGRAEKLRRFSHALTLNFPPAHASWRDIFSEAELRQIIQPHWLEQLAHGESQTLFAEYFAKHFEEVRDCHPLDQASYVDIKTWLADDVLVKADRMSMAHSLEVRCPLLDHRIVEFAAQLPPSFKLRRFSKKHILRLSQRSRLPASTLNRPKQGFNAPISQWVLGPLRQLCQDALFSQSMRTWFNPREIQRLWKEHENKNRDNGLKLFGLLTVGLFLEHYSARRPIARDVARSLNS